MKPIDYALLAVILILAVLAARYAWKRRGSSCGGECGSCPCRNGCSQKKKK